MNPELSAQAAPPGEVGVRTCAAQPASSLVMGLAGGTSKLWVWLLDPSRLVTGFTPVENTLEACSPVVVVPCRTTRSQAVSRDGCSVLVRATRAGGYRRARSFCFALRPLSSVAGSRHPQDALRTFCVIFLPAAVEKIAVPPVSSTQEDSGPRPVPARHSDLLEDGVQSTSETTLGLPRGI